MIPWFPLLPSGRCRPDPKTLVTVRTDAVATALALTKVGGRQVQQGALWPAPATAWGASCQQTHDGGTSTRPEIPQLGAAMPLVDNDTRPMLLRMTGASGATWVSLKRHMLGALQELVDVFPQDYYPPPRPLDPAHVDAFRAQADELWGAWQANVEMGSDSASPVARLNATLILQHLDELSSELQRLHTSCGAAITGLEGSLYGFLGLSCCHPAP